MLSKVLEPYGTSGICTNQFMAMCFLMLCLVGFSLIKWLQENILTEDDYVGNESESVAVQTSVLNLVSNNQR